MVACTPSHSITHETLHCLLHPTLSLQSSDDSDEDELSDIDMDSVDPVLLNNMDNALASAFKSRSQAKCLKKDDKG